MNFEDLFGGAGGARGGGPGADYGSLFEQFFGGGAARAGAGGGRRPQRPRAPAKGHDLEGEISIDLPTAVRGGDVGLNVSGTSITVKIPAGTRDGHKLRLSGKGVPAPGGLPGDLILTVKVLEHAAFWMLGDDLHMRVPVSFVEAWRGAKVKVPTPQAAALVRAAAVARASASAARVFPVTITVSLPTSSLTSRWFFPLPIRSSMR